MKTFRGKSILTYTGYFIGKTEEKEKIANKLRNFTENDKELGPVKLKASLGVRTSMESRPVKLKASLGICTSMELGPVKLVAALGIRTSLVTILSDRLNSTLKILKNPTHRC